MAFFCLPGNFCLFLSSSPLQGAGIIFFGLTGRCINLCFHFPTTQSKCSPSDALLTQKETQSVCEHSPPSLAGLVIRGEAGANPLIPNVFEAALDKGKDIKIIGNFHFISFLFLILALSLTNISLNAIQVPTITPHAACDKLLPFHPPPEQDVSSCIQ